MTPWKTVRLKHLCLDAGQYGMNISSESYADSGVRLLRTTDISSGTLTPAEDGVFVSECTSDRFTLREGDLLLSRSGTPPGQSYLVKQDDRGSTFAGYLVRFRPANDVDPRFLSHVARSEPFQHTILSEAVASTIQNFNAERYANIEFRVPDQREQSRIAEFLDAETAQIDRLIELRISHERLVLERSEAVLSSLFSGQEGHRKYRFRHLMQSNPCYGVLVPKFAESGVPLIRVSDLGKLDHNLERLPRIEKGQAQEYRRTRLSPGDLLITVVGATIGRCDVAPEATCGFNVSRALARIQLIPGLSPQMIAAWVRGRDFRAQAELATSGAAAQPALNMSDITHFSIWIPETDSGRRILANRVDDHVHQVQGLLSLLRQQRALLAERRQALITAAVTGQFDVSTASGRNVTDGVQA
ncbi:restriction endonuclease subunit S [Streptomyces anulatus]|uniref:restriction endonuclease subunit S n=1 Tax=Streptomyces anulatus TaxID=1892 RepID=UPI00343B41EC